MDQILEPGQTVTTESGASCQVGQFLGGGGQGEVYKADVGGKIVALKWYFPLQATDQQRKALEALVKLGPPNDRFLWPLEITTSPDVRGFGYIMPLRDPRFKGIVDLMKRRVEPTFRVLATAGLELSHSYLELHAQGLSYRDISFGNVFFEPQTGDVLICDNDNVAVDNQAISGVLGTPRFMAPEIVRGEAQPSTQTDLFSLAVLLFYMLMVHHPLEGKKELAIKCLDLPAMNRLYGAEPLFIFDPSDDTNRPVPGYHDNALDFWSLYPEFLRELFTEAFTLGLRDPLERVRESEWRAAMVRLRDSIYYCTGCGAENFYDVDRLKAAGGNAGACWSCGAPLALPPRLRIDRAVIMLNHDTQLYPHHLDSRRMYDFSQPEATVTRHPTNPKLWGLRNLTAEKWVITTADGTVRDVEPGRNVPLAEGTQINFGNKQGEIRA